MLVFLTVGVASDRATLASSCLSCLTLFSFSTLPDRPGGLGEVVEAVEEDANSDLFALLVAAAAAVGVFVLPPGVPLLFGVLLSRGFFCDFGVTLAL